MPNVENSSYDTVVAIDGPSGSGKSTIAKRLASELGLTYIDTGAMFRSVAFLYREENWEQKQSLNFEELLNPCPFVFEQDQIFWGKQNISQEIRTEDISALASSKVAKIPEVRKCLKLWQQALAKKGACVMEGRDIGTVVFPKAFCKFFLKADITVRAQRRFHQLKEKDNLKGATLEDIYQDLLKRDQVDSDRKEAPLIQSKDAIAMDSTTLSIEQMLGQMKEVVLERSSTLLGKSLG